MFPAIADLRAENSLVTFENLKVGQVSSVELDPDLRHLRVKLDLQSDMKGHLGKDTQFWIIGQSESLSNLSEIKAMISGPSIGIKPASGAQQDRYEGLTEDPVLAFGAAGTTFKLHADSLGSAHAHTPIYYRGKRVGVVKSTAMPSPRGFAIEAFINQENASLVHDGTRFWRAGPVHVSMGGDGPTVQFQSLPALVQGAIAFDTPDGPAQGPSAASGHDFELYEDEDAARHAPDREGVAYRVTFESANGVPPVHAPVTLMGKQVGSVSQSALQFDVEQQRLKVGATIVIEPRTIELQGAAAGTDPRAQIGDMIRALIGQGLRAELTNSPPVIGGEQVALRIVPGPPGTLGTGPIPEIPAAPGGGGVPGVIEKVGDIAGKVDAIPFKQIGDHIDDISARFARLANSPELQATLNHADHTTADLERVASELRRNLPPALASLRDSLTEARSALASAQNLLSARSAAGPGSGDLPQALSEITRAARSIRELADLLDRNPTALLTGRRTHE